METWHLEYSPLYTIDFDSQISSLPHMQTVNQH